MLTWQELWGLLSAIADSVLGASTGILGAILFLASIWVPDELYKRILRYVALGFLCLSPIFAWRDEYRAHQATKDELTAPKVSVIDASAEYIEVLDRPFNTLTIRIVFKNTGKSPANQFTFATWWASGNKFAAVNEIKTQTMANSINPEETAVLPITAQVPVRTIKHAGKEERAMKPEELYFYVVLTYLRDFHKEVQCQELWFKYRISEPKMKHQTTEDKSKFEPIVRKANTRACAS
jgi:hypothetical protein